MAFDFTELDAIVAAGAGADVDPDFFSEIKANFENFNIATMPVYADNAAAITGGAEPGDIYRTSTGALMIVFEP